MLQEKNLETAALGLAPMYLPSHSGVSAHLWLVIGDTREIALTRVGHEITFEYRLSLLAREGDIAVFGGAIHHDFERYRSEQIGLGPIVSINVRGFPGKPLLPLAERCLLDAAAFLRSWKGRSGRAADHRPPYRHGQCLAAAIAEATGLEICVASPPPRLTRRVNDKLWFARLAAEVLGGLPCRQPTLRTVRPFSPPSVACWPVPPSGSL